MVSKLKILDLNSQTEHCSFTGGILPNYTSPVDKGILTYLGGYRNVLGKHTAREVAGGIKGSGD